MESSSLTTTELNMGCGLGALINHHHRRHSKNNNAGSPTPTTTSSSSDTILTTATPTSPPLPSPCMTTTTTVITTNSSDTVITNSSSDTVMNLTMTTTTTTGTSTTSGKSPPLTPISSQEEDGDENDNENDISSQSDDDDLISVGGSPSPSPSMTSPDTLSRMHSDDGGCREDEYFRPLKKLRMLQVEPPGQGGAGVKSFSITDILSHSPGEAKIMISQHHHHHHHHHPHHHHHRSPNVVNNSSSKNNNSSNSNNNSGNNSSGGRLTTTAVNNVVIQQRIVRPWDPQSKANGRRNSSDSSPLDALFQMTSKTFEGLNGHHENTESTRGSDHQLFSARQPPKKKRKSRTAFTNHQIFELEKRFLYQKYLSPADRDDIAQQLGLTNAQVITWFQNRRAKLKRDMEELKKDVESAKLLSAHKSFLESAHDLGLLKKRPQSQMEMTIGAPGSYHIASPTSSSQSSHSPINLTSESPPSTH